MGGNHPITVGELYTRFGETIPLHKASRLWAARQIAEGEEVSFSSAQKMRFYLMTQFLHTLQCSFSDRPKQWDTVVTLHPKKCRKCGGRFVGPKVGAAFCSRECSGWKR